MTRAIDFNTWNESTAAYDGPKLPDSDAYVIIGALWSSATIEDAVGLPFDRGFSLKNENSLYCSELVWRALSSGSGKDAVPQKSERFGRVYVSISDPSENDLVREAAVITARSDQGGDRQTTRAEAR